MAMAVGVMSGGRWIHQKESLKTKRESVRCSSISSPSVKYPYMTLGISRDASEKDVKKAFRQLAKQYHPDVCKGNNCGVLFHRINEAYDVVMANLRGETDYNLFESQKQKAADDYYVDDEEDEWLGWDGAGMWDYASRMNTMEC